MTTISNYLEDLQVQMSSLGTGVCGRFGNQIFQYIFLQILREEIGCKIAYPNWMGDRIFTNSSHKNYMDVAAHLATFETGIAEVNAIPLISQSHKDAGPMADVRGLMAYVAATGARCLDVYGYFQYHTARLLPWRPRIKEWLELQSSPKAPVIDRLRQLSGDDEKLILAVHVRRGDYLHYGGTHPYFWAASIDGVVKAISDILHGGAKNILIYLCSDDLGYCSAEFTSRNVPHITWRDFNEFADSDEQLAMDFFVMTTADILLAGNSSFSIAASLLNERGRMFLRPSPTFDGMVSYLPWSTEILLTKRFEY